jgi:membrane protease subunit HflK
VAKSEGVSLGVMLVKAIFTAVKTVFFFLTGSVALLVETLHSAANVLTSLGVWWSLRLERQRAEGLLEEQEVAAGRGPQWEAESEEIYRDWRTQRYVRIKTRWEKKLAGLAGFVLMALAGFGMYASAQPQQLGIGIGRLVGAERFAWVTPVVLLFLGLLTYFISRLERQVGAIEGQEDFAAGSVRAKLDALGCFLVAAVFVLNNFQAGQIDWIIGLAIAVVLLLQGLEIIVSAMMSQFEEQRIADFADWETGPEVGRLALGRLLSGSGWLSFFGFLSRGVVMQTGRQRPLRFLYRHLPVLGGIAAAVFLIQSCFFVVPPEQEAIVERFGHALGVSWDPKTGRTLDRSGVRRAGLHVKLPWPIDTVVRIPKHEVQQREFGFAEPPKRRPFVIYDPKFHDVELALITRPPEPRATPEGGTAQQSTGPGYLIVITLRIQYDIDNVAAYYGGALDPHRVLEDQANYLLLTAARARTVDQLLAMDQEQLIGEIRSRLRRRMAELRTGLRIRSVTILWIHPPVEEGTPRDGSPMIVARAYQLAAANREASKKTILDAVNDTHRILPGARARAFSIAEQARSNREIKGRRSDLLIYQPDAGFYIVGKLVKETEQAVIIREPQAEGGRDQKVPRQRLVEPPLRNVDLLIHKPRGVRIGRILAKDAQGRAIRFQSRGAAEPTQIDPATIARQVEGADALHVRPPTRRLECYVLTEEPDKIRVRIENPRGTREVDIPRRLITTLVRSGERGRLSRSQGFARGFAALAEEYNKLDAEFRLQGRRYGPLFRERQAFVTLKQSLPVARKVLLGAGDFEVWLDPRAGSQDILLKGLTPEKKGP